MNALFWLFQYLAGFLRGGRFPSSPVWPRR
jgi:hypothetical protein